MSEPIIIETNLSERMEISEEDLITIMEIARIALENKDIGLSSGEIGHELDLSDEELDRIYEIVEIKEEKANALQR
jgi:orotate phosphoribosyltransferase-like protein